MALAELHGSREIVWTRTGASAVREFYGTWSECLSSSPVPGEYFPGSPVLTVDTVRVTPAGQPGTSATVGSEYTHGKVRVDYTFEYTRPQIGDEPRITWDYSAEMLSTAAGRTWVDTGAVIDQEDLQQSVLYPLLTLTVDMAVETLPLEAMMDLVGKVNDDTFWGAEAGTLLFEGGTSTAQYNYDSGAWYYHVTYRFLWRPRGHNAVWRPAMRAWDSAAGNWEMDGDNYVYQAGTAGTGAWTETDPALYESGDFDTLTGVLA